MMSSIDKLRKRLIHRFNGLGMVAVIGCLNPPTSEPGLRFSLRTLLAAVTLVAVYLGTIMALL